MKDFLNYYLGLKWSALPLKGDSGERHYSRITLSPNKTFILISYPCELKKRFNSFISMQNLLNQKGILVPKIFFISEKKGLLLMEDLGNLSLEQFYFKHHKLTYYELAIDQLLYFQNKLKDHIFEKNFTFSQSLHEMIIAYQQFHFSFLESEKTNLFEEFQNISQKLSSQELVPSHRDFHSRNLHVQKDQIYMIDFQDAGLYPVYYDLISLIEDVYVPLSENERSTLMRYYSEKTNQPIDFVLWHTTACQRLFKAIGSFMSFYNLREQRAHLKYVVPALKKVESSLIKLNSYPFFLKYTQTILSQL